MNLNAQKWFRFARMINPRKKEAYLGEVLASLKLIKIQDCLSALQNRPKKEKFI